MQPAVKQKILRSVLSLFATVFGWGAGFLCILWYMKVTQGRVTDLPALGFWPGIFILAGWSFFFHPLVSWLPAEHPVFGPQVFPLVGMGLAVVAYLLLVGTWMNGSVSSLFGYIYAAVAGGVAAFLYSLGNRALLYSARAS